VINIQKIMEKNNVIKHKNTMAFVMIAILLLGLYELIWLKDDVITGTGFLIWWYLKIKLLVFFNLSWDFNEMFVS
jgi:hypothetical protein